MSKTTAREIMSTHLINATSDTTIEEALRVLINNRITGLPVVDKKGKMIGVVSEYDILQQVAKNKNNPNVYQEKIQFSKKVDALKEDTPLKSILEEFINTKFRRFPVIDKKGNLIGMITRRDLMRVFYYRAKLSSSVDE